MLTEDTKKCYRNLCTKIIEPGEPLSMTEVAVLEVTVGIKSTD
jgi:hypothetical protein